jgi:hypothetical protein
MNINVRFSMAMTLAITGTLIATVAKVHAQSVENFQVKPLSTQVSPNLRNKVDILRPGSNLNPAATQDRFRLFDQFRDNKPGWIEVKKDDDLRRRININEVRPSAVDTFQKIGR